MERIEIELKDMMAAQAETARNLPPLGPTVGRARRRRAAHVVVAGSLAVVTVLGGVAGVRAVTRDDSPPVVAGPSADEPYEFTSTPGIGDVVATGEFRDAVWQLTATPRDEAIASIDVVLTVTRGEKQATDHVEVMASDAAVAARGLLESDLLDGAAAVYGALRDDVASVDVSVVIPGEPTYVPHRFAGPEGDLTVDYFISFVPVDGAGSVNAYDEAGINIGTSSYGGITPDDSAVASGRSGDDPWSVTFSGDGAGRACIVFHAGGDGANGECVTKGEIDAGEPLLLLTFEGPKVLGLVGVISDDVGFVRLVTDDGVSHDLPWFAPPDPERADWPLRLVGVGLEPGTSGLLRVFDGQGNVIDEQPFPGRQAD